MPAPIISHYSMPKSWSLHYLIIFAAEAGLSISAENARMTPARSQRIIDEKRTP